MSSPTSAELPGKASLVDLTENDLPELAAFVAAQSGRPPEETLAHLTWLLLENPARNDQIPLGCGVRATTDALVGCILYLPQFFVLDRRPLLVLGSSCFYVAESHRGFGGALFLKFARAASQWPLFGNSANAVAAQLWKARGAAPIPHSDHELLGVIHWPPVVEELAVRRGTATPAARAIGAASRWVRYVRKLRLPLAHESELEPLSSVEEVMQLALFAPSNLLTARRDESYIRWRYFSKRDPSVALFTFRNRRTQERAFVAANERPRGHRGQIRSLNVLDVFPKPEPIELLNIVAALRQAYLDRADMIVLRCLNLSCQQALVKAGFRRRDFESPNGWFLDWRGKLAACDFYFVPADGDWII